MSVLKRTKSGARPIGYRSGGIISTLGLEAEIELLRRAIDSWISRSSDEMHETLRWQFSGDAKYFRPITVFASFHAIDAGELDEDVRVAALVVELVHNMTLIVDDILDNSEYRRKKMTLHCRFGVLPALMTAGFIVAEAYRIVQSRSREIGLISELISRLGVAECIQWRVRSRPLGTEDWYMIAAEDTGSMFEVCACLGAGSNKLRRFGQLLGILYHGCDDVADVRGVEALGGGGNDDIRDSILTLPASIAIRDPKIAKLFANPTEANRREFEIALQSALPEAERQLDRIADQAREEAKIAPSSKDLITLVDYTRSLSRL